MNAIPNNFDMSEKKLRQTVRSLIKEEISLTEQSNINGITLSDFNWTYPESNVKEDAKEVLKHAHQIVDRTFDVTYGRVPQQFNTNDSRSLGLGVSYNWGNNGYLFLEAKERSSGSYGGRELERSYGLYSSEPLGGSEEVNTESRLIQMFEKAGAPRK